MSLIWGAGLGVALCILYSVVRNYLSNRKVKEALTVAEASRRRREEFTKEIEKLKQDIENAKLNYIGAKSKLSKSRVRRPERSAE